MMRKTSSVVSFRKCASTLALYCLLSVPAHAVPSLFQWGFNIDGTVSTNQLSSGSFDYTTGLGTINIAINGAGNHYAGSFFDHDINPNTTESGNVSGTPGAGQSWELDDIGGDIFANFNAGALDNSNGILQPYDASMAMAWDFALAANQQALISFLVSYEQPIGFYLTQFDVRTNEQLFFSSALNIRGVNSVPEPGTVLLIGAGLAGLLRMQQRKR